MLWCFSIQSISCMLYSQSSLAQPVFFISATSVSSEVHFSLAVPATCNRSPPWRTSLDLLSHTVLPTSCITLASDTSKKGLQSGRYSGCCNSGSNARRPLPQKYRCFHPAVQLNKFVVFVSVFRFSLIVYYDINCNYALDIYW